MIGWKSSWPAHSVRGPSYSTKKGKTPVLAPEEARQLLDSIPVDTMSGKRDRALIGLMTYTFARIGAALGMEVRDVYVQSRRLWVRLHEKGGKRHEMPCHHALEEYLEAYLEAGGLKDHPRSPFFAQSAGERASSRNPPAPSQRLYDDPAPRQGGRHRHGLVLPHVPRHRHHCLSEERRNVGKGGAHGQPHLDTYDAAL